jgi:Fic family protein
MTPSVDDLLKETEFSILESQLLKVEELRAAWASAQPLDPTSDKRLKQKFRLEWNYNSNHIEGNTLTYGETELLLIQGQTVGQHSIREYEEMKAHDVAVEYVAQLAKEDRLIGETDIRDLNKIILKEPFWKEAETLDGRPTRKQVIPGEYKTLPNNVRTPTGEVFEFATPADTPSRMRALVDWLRKELGKPTLHPLETAAKLHHEFVLIHPFDDGNGRVARLLTNYVLIRTAYPPLIIKSIDKANYLAALRLADVGDLAALTEYLARQLEWSLKLGLRAAKGESLEEPTDVEKEIAIFIREQEAKRIEVKKRSPDTLRELYNLSWEYLFSSFEQKMKKLSPLFSEALITVHPPGKPDFKNNWRSAFNHLLEKQQTFPVFRIRVGLNGYKGETPFSVEATLQLHFEEFRYAINLGLRNPIQKLYSEPILSDEADQIVNAVLRKTFDDIKVKVTTQK